MNFLRAGITAAGGTPVKPRQSYNLDLNTRAKILETANILEPTGVAAYDGATYVKNTGKTLPGINSTTENWGQAAEAASRAFAAEVVYWALRAIDTTPQVIVPAMM